MTVPILGVVPSLRGASRAPALASAGTAGQVAGVLALVGTGAGAALLCTFLDLDLRVPGHRIVLSVFPTAMGFALVPRRGAGTIMGVAAALTTGALGTLGVRLPGVGALTSLVLVGPLLDAALRWGRQGWRLYGAFMAAGAASNAAAFTVRAAARLVGLGRGGGGRSLAEWLPVSVWTYAIAGILAGLIGAVAWFRFHDPPAASAD